MKIKVKKVSSRIIEINGDYIKLDSLLKYASIVDSGGASKILINDGKVRVNGDVCTQRGKKIRHGDSVRCTGVKLLIVQKE